MTVEKQMSLEEVLEVLAGLERNGRVTVCLGSSGSDYMEIPGLHVLSKFPTDAQPQDLEEVELSNGYCLKRSEEAWLFQEQRGKARQFNLLSIKARRAVVAAQFFLDDLQGIKGCSLMREHQTFSLEVSGSSPDSPFKAI